MRKKEYDVLLLLLLAVLGGFCACHREQETGMTVTPVPEGERIPIDEEHFTSAVFRSYLADYYDVNQDGYLSYPERADFRYFSIGYYEHEFEQECLDGFEYFPDLKELDISCAEKVVLRNCPSLVKISGEEGHIGTLIIEDCPVLERMYFFDFWMDTLCITGAPALELGRAHYAGGNHITLDGNVALDIETEYHEAFIYTGSELETDRLYFQTVEDYVQTLGVEWVNTGEKTAPLGEEAVRKCVEKGELDFCDFRVSEMPEGSPDSAGRRGFFITAENKKAGCTPVIFPLYTEEEPEAEDFFVRPVEIYEVKVLKYSPNRGNFASIRWKLEFVYRTGQKETVLGQTERSHYILTLPDGSVRVYGSLEEWEENGEWYPLKEGYVRINEENFSSPVFRRYLNSEYNVDGGYEKLLSLREREAVEVMDFSASIRFDGQILDGFQYFPKLRELSLGRTGALVVENHPSLEVIGGDAPGLKKLVVRNCPELRRIDLDLSKIEEVVIEGCGKLEGKDSD